MLAGINAFNSTFLSDLNALENRLSTVTQQLSSGYRVSQASDDPAAVPVILAYQSQIDQVTTTQSNLSRELTVAQTADSALTSATDLLSQLTSIAAQGSTSTETAASRAILGQKVQAIAQQMVAIANTSFNGRYIFGGDDSATQPYTFDWTAPSGVVRNNTSANTATIHNTDNDSIVPSLTAQQIFDGQNTNGSATAGNIFQNIYALGQALQNNDQAAIDNSAQSLQASAIEIGTSTTKYGNTINWLQNSSDSATAKLDSLRGLLSPLRDTDVAQAATELSLDQTAMQAALQAHGSLNLKSLFSYLG